jgi:hypothetical protein
MMTTFLEMLLVTGIIPTASSVYPVSALIQPLFMFLESVILD